MELQHRDNGFESRWLVGAALLFITMVGASLRIYGLDFDSLWADEIYSVMLSQDLDVSAIVRGVRHDVHPPGYQLLLAVFIALFGDSEVAVRSLSVLAGTLAVPLLYLLGARCYGRAEGLIAAALLAVSLNAVFYSQETRSFALLLLSSIATGLAFFQTFFATDSRRDRWCKVYILVSLVALYVHYYAFLVLAVQLLIGVAIAWRHREARALLKTCCIALCIGFAPWLPVFLRHLKIKQFWIPEPDLASLQEFFWFVFSDSRTLAIAFAVAGAIALATVAMRRERWREHGAMLLLWLVCWALLPPLLAYAKSLVSTPIFTSRNLIICLPPVYLLIARAFSVVLALLWRRQQLPLASGVAIACLALGVQQLYDRHFYSTPKRVQYREAAQQALSNGAGGGDVVVLATDDWFDFYLAKLDGGRRADYRLSTPAEFAQVAPALAEHKARRLWLLQGHTQTGDTPLVEAIKAEYRPTYHRDFFMARIVLFERIDAALSSAGQR